MREFVYSKKKSDRLKAEGGYLSAEKSEKEQREEADKSILTDKQFGKAMNAAVRILTFTDRTEAQLREKLKEKDFSKEEIEHAVSYVRDLHYLDDQRYAENYLRRQSDRKGKKRIFLELQQKGISKELIDRIRMADEDEDREYEAALMLLKKRGGSVREPDDRFKNKMLRFLGQRGFSYDISSRAWYAFLEEREESRENEIT